jgi:hypothetical protein
MYRWVLTEFSKFYLVNAAVVVVVVGMFMPSMKLTAWLKSTQPAPSEPFVPHGIEWESAR